MVATKAPGYKTTCFNFVFFSYNFLQLVCVILTIHFSIGLCGLKLEHPSVPRVVVGLGIFQVIICLMSFQIFSRLMKLLIHSASLQEIHTILDFISKRLMFYLAIHFVTILILKFITSYFESDFIGQKTADFDGITILAGCQFIGSMFYCYISLFALSCCLVKVEKDEKVGNTISV